MKGDIPLTQPGVSFQRTYLNLKDMNVTAGTDNKRNNKKIFTDIYNLNTRDMVTCKSIIDSSTVGIPQTK